MISIGTVGKAVYAKILGGGLPHGSPASSKVEHVEPYWKGATVCKFGVSCNGDKGTAIEWDSGRTIKEFTWHISQCSDRGDHQCLRNPIELSSLKGAAWSYRHGRPLPNPTECKTPMRLAANVLWSLFVKMVVCKQSGGKNHGESHTSVSVDSVQQQPTTKQSLDQSEALSQRGGHRRAFKRAEKRFYMHFSQIQVTINFFFSLVKS